MINDTNYYKYAQTNNKDASYMRVGNFNTII